MANQYVNKVIIGKEVKLDLTADSVTPDKLAKGITAHDKTGAPITGTSTKDVDSTDATVAVAEMLDGKTAYARGAKLTGTMPNNGAVAGKITQKDGKYTIPMGFHDGSGSAAIDETEQAKLVPANIREGVTILGVEGSMSSSEGMKPQAKSVTPTFEQQTVLPDRALQLPVAGHGGGHPDQLRGQRRRRPDPDGGRLTMAVNKVVLGSETLLDLTGDTVTRATLLAGHTAHNAAGEQIEGEYTPPDVFTGASAEGAGTSGLVPPPAAGDEKKYLCKAMAAGPRPKRRRQLKFAGGENMPVYLGDKKVSIFAGAGAAKLQEKTVTPTERQQTVTPDTGYDGMSQVTVDAVPAGYIGSGVTKKAAATYTPKSTDQVIAAGQYLSGAQTIKGDTNLVGGNILAGKSIFGVAGTVVIQKYYTGSSEPSSSIGSNGDLYLQTGG